MSWLTNLIGSGAGLIVIAFGMVVLKYMGHLPSATHPWIHRGIIVLMFAGGAALAVTAIGGYVDGAIRWIAGLAGGVDYGIPHVAIVVALLFLIAGTIVGIIFAPDAGTAMVAILLPILLALPAGGIIHSLYLAVDAPAIHLASSLNAILAG